MASHMAPTRRRASSAGNSMPANPAMPHISGRPHYPPRDSRCSRSRRLGAQHVRSSPECAENEIENGQPGIRSKESCNQAADDCPLEPTHLNHAVVRLETTATTSHEPEHRGDETQPQQESRKPGLRSKPQVGVVSILLAEVRRKAAIGFVVAADSDAEHGIALEDLPTDLEDLEPLQGRAVRIRLRKGLDAGELAHTLESMPGSCRNQDREGQSC